jgi:hypothetical protein
MVNSQDVVVGFAGKAASRLCWTDDSDSVYRQQLASAACLVNDSGRNSAA